MADTSYKTALANFYANFQKNNTAFALSKQQKRTNNVNALNALLDNLMTSSEEREKVKNLLSTRNENSNYGDKDSLFPALPSYNTRSPYMEIWINGILIIPNTNIDDSAFLGNSATVSTTSTGAQITASANNIRPGTEEFTNFDIIGQTGHSGLDVNFDALKLDMPMGGVSSTISGTLTLYSRTPIEFLTFLSTNDSEDTAGLSQCRIRFGWNVARTDGKAEKLLTPYMTFLIMNVGMSDPGKTMGSEFTLTLQDAGSAVLQNSSADVGLQENWPQVQLRLILEKFLGLRLFTLDDLLLLGENEENKRNFNLSSLTSNYTSKDQVLNEISKLTNQTRPDGSVILTNAEALDLQTGFLKAFDSQKEAGASDKDAITKALISDKTFFVTNPTPALRVNSNTFENTINSLLNKIVCRWYPVDNKNLDKEVTEASKAEEEIRGLKAKFDSDGQLSTEELAKFAEEKEKVASTCILIYIPHFPAGLYTSSNMLFGADIAQEEGAFLLLPKITTDYSLNAVNLPLIYGPGGSSLPYFYGGAQNVFARVSDTLLGSPKHFSNRVGEILDLTANFSNLIALMKDRYTEEMTYRETGKFLGIHQTVKESKEQKRLANVKLKEKLQAELKAKTNGKDPSEFLKDWESKNLPKFKAIRGRFKQSIAPRYLVNSVEYSNTAKNSPAKTVAGNILRHRIATFLNYPFSIGMSILGDPYLIRQGIGGFEVINYYPSLDGTTFKYNAMLSGLYLPQKISHNISLGEYTTEIQAVRVPDTSADSAQGRIRSVIKIAEKDVAYTQGQVDDIATNVLYEKALLDVNLDTLAGTAQSGLSVYKLTDAQLTKYNQESQIFDYKTTAISEAEQQKYITKYKTKDFQTAKSMAKTELQVKILTEFIAEDDTLSQAEKLALQAKVKGLHNNALSSAQSLSALQWAIGGANFDTNTKTVTTSTANSLDALYSKLKTSRYEDIRSALDQQAKKQ
jgi:hypothetical protein